MTRRPPFRTGSAGLSPTLEKYAPLGDPRKRANAVQGVTENDIEAPLAINKKTGRVTVAIGDALAIERGAITPQVGAPLAVAPGSPRRIVLSVDDSLPMDRRGRMTARPKARAVRNDSNAEGATLADVLNMLFAVPGATQVGIGALPVGQGPGTVTAGNDGRIVALGLKAALSVGTAVLAAGTVVVPDTAVSGTCLFFLQHQTLGGVPGLLSVTARVPGTSFTITSASLLDTSIIAYVFFEPF